MLTLPLMIFLGAPATVANASNRIFMLFQSTAGTISLFHKERPELRSLMLYALCTLTGALIGAYVASLIDPDSMKRVIGFLLLAALVLYVGKNFIKTEQEAKPTPTLLHYPILFAMGLYGGFIQAGLGAILYIVLHRLCEMPKIAAMGAKNFIIAFYTLPVLIIFLIHGQVWWDMGLVLAAGAILGAKIAASIAVRISTRAVMILVGVVTFVSAISLIIG